MGISKHFSDDNHKLVISVEGVFDFTEIEHFKPIMESLEHPTRECEVDLRETTCLDSSAIGMLLMLKDIGKNKGIEVSILSGPRNYRELFGIPISADMLKKRAVAW